MSDAHRGLEPAYSNLIDHLDMVQVRLSPRFLAECVRDAKRAGAGDEQIQATFIACLGGIARRGLSEDELRNLGEQFRERLHAS